MVSTYQSVSSLILNQRKICVVTGGTDGIGKAIAAQLALIGHFVIIVARNELKGQRVVQDINEKCCESRVVFYRADLSLLEETHRVSNLILSHYSRIDLLINNAGVFSPVRKETKEGFELTFALNYLSPVLLTISLLPALKASHSARILNMTSVDHKLARIRFNDLQSNKYPLGTRAYGQSKLALMMFTRTLAKKLQSSTIRVNAIHPGIIRTKITEKTPGFEGFITKWLVKIFGTPLDKCVKNILRFALSPKFANTNGVYFSKNRIGRCSPRARNTKAAEKLWKITLKLVEGDVE